MTADRVRGRDETLAEKLTKLGADRGAKKVLVQMATNGQLLELKCEISPRGRKHFDNWTDVREPSDRNWCPNHDHYPQLHAATATEQ